MIKLFPLSIVVAVLGCALPQEPTPTPSIDAPAFEASGFTPGAVAGYACGQPSAAITRETKIELGWWGQHELPDGNYFLGIQPPDYPRAEDFDPLRTGSTVYSDLRFMAAVRSFQDWAAHAMGNGTFAPPGVPAGTVGSCGVGWPDPWTRKALGFYVATHP